MGIKLAKALGHDVLAISTSANKKSLAMDKGATMFAVSKDPESMKQFAGKCDIILNTVAANHDMNVYLPLLAKGGSTIVQIGGAVAPHAISQIPLMFNRYIICSLPLCIMILNYLPIFKLL